MLTGYRVLDITQFVAGPTCTRIMAELGAEVIKVELAPFGDRGRFSGDKPRDPRFAKCSQSTYFFQHNHSKKSLAVDIKQERGRALLKALVPKVDVLVENFAPGVMTRAGLGWDALEAIHPGLVMCSISLAGQSGPLSDKPGFDYMGAALAGITAGIGESDRGPAQVATAIGDSATGVTAAMAIGFALLHRERTGEGQYIECSLLDTYFHMHEVNVPKASLRGKSFAPR
jgi:CoA:oxalate CoA-transferase